jgi:HCOMODA/2-hydroxy-3-carboxy-muconic semialdehyde decarboxylase
VSADSHLRQQEDLRVTQDSATTHHRTSVTCPACGGIHGAAESCPTARGGRSAAPADIGLIEDLVAANRILAAQQVVDGFGHVSVRHDKDPSRFLLSRSMAPALVTTEDILEFDFDGNALVANGPAVYLERFIHAEIYRRRPDVNAVVHSHSPAVIPFAVTTVPLRPLYHMSAFLGPGVPVFEIRDVAGESDMLIRNSGLGASLAACLADKPAALMRGHGSIAVGSSLPLAVFRAVYLEINARMQADALRLGPVTFLTETEAALAAATSNNQAPRAWDLWKTQVRRTGG